MSSIHLPRGAIWCAPSSNLCEETALTNAVRSYVVSICLLTVLMFGARPAAGKPSHQKPNVKIAMTAKPLQENPSIQPVLRCVERQARSIAQQIQDPLKGGEVDFNPATRALADRFVCGFGDTLDVSDPSTTLCSAEAQAEAQALDATLSAGDRVAAFDGPGGWAEPASAADVALVEKAKEARKKRVECIKTSWATLQTALETAGDPCAEERVKLKRLRHERAATTGYVSALWQCERGASPEKRACYLARAKEQRIWARVARLCGSQCTSEMDASEACRYAFGTMQRDRDDCVRLYQPIQAAERQACAPLACEESKEAESQAWMTTLNGCRSENEKCWQWAKTYRQNWEQCHTKGEGCRDVGAQNYLPSDCQGYDKPCEREAGIDFLCTRSARSGQYYESTIQTCKKELKTLGEQTVQKCPASQRN